MTYISLYIMCMYVCRYIISVPVPSCPCGRPTTPCQRRRTCRLARGGRCGNEPDVQPWPSQPTQRSAHTAHMHALKARGKAQKSFSKSTVQSGIGLAKVGLNLAQGDVVGAGLEFI